MLKAYKKSELMQHQFNFIRRLSWFISSNFGKKSLFKCASQPEIAKKSLKPLIFGRSRSLKVMDVGTPGKVVSNAQVCVYLRPFSR